MILVTGAAGFIAFHLIKNLLESGTPVMGIDNFDPFYDRTTKQQNLSDLVEVSRRSGTPFHFFEQDICFLTPQLLNDHAIHSVVHLAAKAGVRPSLLDPEGYLRTNVLGTLKVLEFCRHRQIPRLLFGSSSSVYGDTTHTPFSEDAIADRPLSPYGASKRTGELYCATYAHLYGITVASLRFFTVYGPRQRPDLAIHKFSKLINSGQPITLYGDGNSERDYTYVTDIVQGIMRALDWSTKQNRGNFDVFNLGGSATTSLKDLVLILERSLGKTATLQWETHQPGDVQKTYADLAKSAKILGYSPQTGIKAGIHKFSDWFLTENPIHHETKAA